MPTRTATPNRKSTTNAPSSTRKHKGVVDRTSGRSSPVVSMRSPSNKALTVTRRLLWINNGSPKNGTARYSGAPNVTQLTQECSLWVKSRHRGTSNQCPLYPQKRTLGLSREMSNWAKRRHFCPLVATDWPTRGKIYLEFLLLVAHLEHGCRSIGKNPPNMRSTIYSPIAAQRAKNCRDRQSDQL